MIPTLDGKSRGYGLGDEWSDLRLPPFYAIEHSDLDDAKLVAKAEEYIESGQYDDQKHWLRRKISQGHYSLSSFYNREPALDRLLDLVRNHLVIVTAQHGRSKKREGIEVGLFGEYDIEHVVKGMFVAMTRGEFPSTTEHLK
ncbi:hypothetical protein HOD38_05745 [archaeon]|jgi:hypothetical protein|nr:hypothetical protein [archaeon]MBT4397741.1 hypothetical protein [archaeon]MBT4441238.1 hypothetical protein [archaeon]